MPKSTKTPYTYKKGEKSLYAKRKKRLSEMYEKKKKLGINDKIDRMDALYTPHLTTLDDPNSFKIQTSQEFINDSILVEKSRKSMPLAFEKITTAQALLIQENPQGVMKAFKEEYKVKNPFIQNVYYENFTVQRKKEILKKYAYHLAKYGIAYWREYIKKTYRKQHEETLDEQGNTSYNLKWVYDVFDVVGENINPKNVLLDDNCLSVKDVNKPANDCSVYDYLTQEEFEAIYPKDIYPNSEFVQENQQWMFNDDSQTEKTTDGKTKIQLLDYENKFENVRETWANGIPIKSVPLPGDRLSLNGDKWVEDQDNYDGIGIGQIIEIYLPIVDDIVNTSLERLRQIVRPNEDWYNGIQLDDEADDVDYGSGSVRKFNGVPGSVVYNQPPQRSAAEANEKAELMTEIDTVTMIPRDLAGQTAAKTAYQSAQNREMALQKLALPLGSIKKTIEDAANLDLYLYQLAYSEPIQTIEYNAGDSGFEEGIAILNQANELGLEEDRVVIMEENEGQPVKIARRKFREMELPLDVEQTENDEGITGRIVLADEKKFWEMTPKDFKWEGAIEIIGESFLPVSKTLQDQQDKETIEYLMNIPTTDEMGNPVLNDDAGQPFTINKVRLLKDRCSMNKNFDPDKYIVPLTAQNQGQGNLSVPENPLESKTDLSAANLVEVARPEVGNLEAL
jgi:hypothetical protein